MDRINNPKRLASFSIVILAFFAAVVTQAAKLLPAQEKNLSLTSIDKPVVLTDGQQEYQLGLHLELLEDPSGSLTIEDITSPNYANQFVQSATTVPNFGYTQSVYWVRFTLDNQTTQTNQWLLEQGFANTQYIDLYYPSSNGQGYSVKQTGILRPVSTRDLIYPNIVFSLNLPLKTTQTYYLRIASGASMTIPLTLWTPNAFIVQSGHSLILHWLIYGALLALLGYHVFLLITLKETVFLYFIIMITSILATLLEYTGYMGVYILPSLYALKAYYFPLFIAALYGSIILFSDSFLQLKTRHPKLHLASMVFLVIWGVFIAFIPFVSYPHLSQAAAPIQLATIAFTWVVGFYAWRKGFKPMGFFMLAWLGMAASLFLLLLVRVGILPSTYLTENLFLFGCIFMAVSWSIALADRINLLKSQTDQANRDFRQSERKLSQILESLPLGVVVYGKDQKPSYINKRTAELLSNPEKNLYPDVDAGRTLAQAIEHFSFQIAGTDQQYPVEKFPVSRALNGDPVFADDVEIDDGQHIIPLEIWASPVRDEHGNIESAVAAFQDITLRKQANNELELYRKNLEQLVNERTAELSASNEKLDHEVQERKSLEQSFLQRIAWLSAINEVRQNVSGVDSLPMAYEKLSDAILNLIRAQSVFILSWDEQDRQFQMQSRTMNGVIQANPEVIHKMFKKGSPLRLDLEQGKMILLSPDQLATLPFPVGEYMPVGEQESLLLSPLLASQAVNGVLGIAINTSVMELSAYQHALIERISYDLAHLIDDAIVLDQRKTLATIEERNRLARELHDSVAQALYGISLFTDATRLALESNRLEVVRQHLDDLGELSQEAMSDMRMLIFELRPPILEKEGLAAALQSRLDAVESRAGVKTILNVKGVLNLSQDQESELYHIAQEALNNVVKHAHARQVRVDLIGHVDSIRLMIEDDGIGFDLPTAEQGGGQGVRNIRERAEIIGAKCSINSEIGRGTQIVIEVNP